MNKDIRLSVSFWDHWKTIILKSDLGYAAIESLQRLWCFAAINKPDGTLSGMTLRTIEIAAHWSGEPGAFVSKLVELRFLDAQDGVFVLHDWEDHNGYAAHAGDRAAQGKKAADARWKRRTGGDSGPKGGKNADSNADSNAVSIAPSNAPIPIPIPIPIPVPVQKSGDAAQARPAHTGKGTRWLQGQGVPEAWISRAQQDHPHLDVPQEAESFVDYWVAKPGKDGFKLDWEATWRNWIRNARTRNGATGFHQRAVGGRVIQ